MKKRIHLMATGGTIAGRSSSVTPEIYSIGQLDIQDVMSFVPGIEQLADISHEQFINVGSPDITIEEWIILANRINGLLQGESVDGIVITHGTDTLEETAYFLNLVVKSDKPVVVVGAMRSSNSLSADGPLNLYDAIAVAAADESRGKGVLVVMGGKIFGARDVTKTSTLDVDSFKAPNKGPLGYVFMAQVQFHFQPLKSHTIHTPFCLDDRSSLPQVVIIYECLGIDTVLLEAVMCTDAQGVVFAGLGDGNIAKPERDLLEKARDRGLVVVRSSRTGSGSITYNGWMGLDRSLGLIPGNDLNPQKARILLMLALTQTNEVETITRYFSSY